MPSTYIVILIIAFVAILIGLFVFVSKTRFDENGYDKNGYDRYGFNRTGVHKNGTKLDRKGFSVFGFNASGNHRNGTRFGEDGYDVKGYDKNGFGKDGFNARGRDKEGYDRAGYTAGGFNRKHIHKNGTNFNENGWDYQGYGKDGYNSNGYDRNGFDCEGYSAKGFNSSGFDRNGYDEAGFDKTGYNRKGFDRKGFDRDGYNTKGFDSEGYNRNGYNKDGYDVNGYDMDGFNVDGFNANGFDEEGFDESGTAWWHWRDGTDATVQTVDFERTIYVESAESVNENPIINNAYAILGLNNLDLIKNVTRRAKEIERLAKIDQTPEYHDDLPYFRFNRDTTSVKQAIQNLSDPKRKIGESFFWFDINDNEDRAAQQSLLQGQIFAAFWRWNNKYVKTNDLLALKNLVIVETMYLSLSGSSNMLAETLEDWKLLINSDAFWVAFEDNFQRNDELGVDVRLIHSFRKDIVAVLADFYYRMSVAYNDDDITTTFASTFGIISKSFREKKITPLLRKITSSTTEIIAMHSRENSNKSPLKIPKLAEKIESAYMEINAPIVQLKEYGLQGDHEVESLSEEAAQTLRNLAIDILNMADENQIEKSRTLAESLLNKAKNLATTRVLRDRIQADFNDIKNQKDAETAMKRVESAISRGNFRSAQDELYKLFEVERNPANRRFLADQIQMLRKAELNQLFKRCLDTKDSHGALRIINQLLEEETDPSERASLRQVKQQLEQITNPYGYRY
jgi:hypothetical protein